jgi:serine phosphatase RsbU (regulator of sigma subunit)/anti-sigma regulatory factor (Ser/Thr protein kinase)
MKNQYYGENMSDKPSFLKRIFKRSQVQSDQGSSSNLEMTSNSEIKPLDIPPDDPFLDLISTAPGLIEVDKHDFDSPTLERLRTDGIKLVLPLVSQGDLIGLLNLGSRMSEQEYSSDDFQLLNNLATQASPSLRVAQLARQQQLEAQERERISYELRVARLIQETLLPKEIPSLSSWSLDVHWQPAREVGGDFYDFIHLPENRLGILVADVTDKGIPAAMVMATSRSLLRETAERLIEPGDVLAYANDVLHSEIPPKMFVTCLYLVLNLESGEILFSNAGHNPPYLHSQDQVSELIATGMPLGLMPEMDYDQNRATIQPGETLMLSSDGLVEAHNPAYEMFGFPRVQELVRNHQDGAGLITHLMQNLRAFVGESYEQEDDITILTIERLANPQSAVDVNDLRFEGSEGMHVEGEFAIASEPGSERRAAEQVLEVIAPLNLPVERRERLETAVAEATMNAMEHGNNFDPEKKVEIGVFADEHQVTISITDHGGSSYIPKTTQPNLEAKLDGEQPTRGWGMFLIKNMVDEMNIIQTENSHTIELLLRYGENGE